MNRFMVLDVGNSVVHAALADSTQEQPIDPDSVPVSIAESDLDQDGSIESLCDQEQQLTWWTVCVNRDRLASFQAHLRDRRPQDQIRQLTFEHSPLRLAVDAPDKLGMDRVAAAVAANSLRSPHKAALIIDSGTAITVDVVDSGGCFRGGAIMPGVGMSAVALDERTDGLPRIIPLDAPPPSIGGNTEAAIRSGLFWGTFGGVEKLIERHAAAVDEPIDVFLTGGAAVWSSLLKDARLAPNLTLLGVAQMVLASQGVARDGGGGHD